jgi:hypothetical protein
MIPVTRETESVLSKQESGNRNQETGIREQESVSELSILNSEF